MSAALARLQSKENCVSQYIYHKLMGHDVDDILFKLVMPKKFSSPGLPELNHSQISAIKAALQRPLSLIQVLYPTRTRDLSKKKLTKNRSNFVYN